MVSRTSRLLSAALLVAVSCVNASAQDVVAVVAAASKAMGVENLTSITFSGTASTGNFGQSKDIAGPLQMTAITNYTRAIDFAQPASRAFGPTMPPAISGAPPPQPGNFNQLIVPTNPAWAQQSQIWVTPWAFLKGARAAGAIVRQQRTGTVTHNIVTWNTTVKSPSGDSYRLIGYLNAQTNLVERVETWIDHPVMGDLHLETFYSNYRDVDGVMVPGTILQKQGEMEAFTATITAATINPGNIEELLTPPARGGGPGAAGAGAAGARAGGPPAAPSVETQQLAPGVFRVTGGYVSLVIDMGDHAVIVESGQSEARALTIIEASRRALPDRPIRFVINTHPHFDHASGLATVAALNIPIVTQENNRAYIESALSERRSLVGDLLANSTWRPTVQGFDERRTMTGSNGRVIELYHVQGLEHSDGMLMVHLPAEKILFTADFNMPNAGGPAPVAPVANPSFVTLVNNIERLKLDFSSFVTVHAPNPDRPLTRADVYAQAGRPTP